MSRQHPWRAEHPDAVIVARPSRWGNPERAQDRSLSEREAAYWWFERHLRMRRVPGSPAAWIAERIGYPSDDEIRAELRGRDLLCWCPLSSPCHADVLLLIANSNGSVS